MCATNGGSWIIDAMFSLALQTVAPHHGIYITEAPTEAPPGGSGTIQTGMTGKRNQISVPLTIVLASLISYVGKRVTNTMQLGT